MVSNRKTGPGVYRTDRLSGESRVSGSIHNRHFFGLWVVWDNHQTQIHQGLLKFTNIDRLLLFSGWVLAAIKPCRDPVFVLLPLYAPPGPAVTCYRILCSRQYELVF